MPGCQRIVDAMGPRIVTTYTTRFEAELAVAKLASNGIPAGVLTDSAGGFEPQWEYIRGVRVVTDEADLGNAAEILGVEPPPAQEPMSPQREHMVRTVRNVIFGVAAAGILVAVIDGLS